MSEQENGPEKAEIVRKKGAPLGNQNARVHGFYSTKLDESQKQELEEATGVNGIDAEIALMRVKIKSLIERDPENTRLILQAINTLAKMVKIKNNISKEDTNSIWDAVGNVLKDIIMPMGIGLLKK